MTNYGTVVIYLFIVINAGANMGRTKKVILHREHSVPQDEAQQRANKFKEDNYALCETRQIEARWQVEPQELTI